MALGVIPAAANQLRIPIRSYENPVGAPGGVTSIVTNSYKEL